jgi:hypothetical protein
MVKKYDFLPILNKKDEKYKHYKEHIVTSLQKSISLTLHLSSSFFFSESSNSGN